MLTATLSGTFAEAKAAHIVGANPGVNLTSLLDRGEALSKIYSGSANLQHDHTDAWNILDRGGTVRRQPPVTRQTVSPRSSAISSAPALSTASPTGRPCALPLVPTKPVTTSCVLPAGLPPAKGMYTTL